MRKHFLEDITFLIPVRIDSIIRLENLLLSIDNITNYYHVKIIVLEATKYNNGILEKLIKRKVSYLFYQDHDDIFHKTKYINILSQEASTKYIAIWDADVILNHTQIIDCYSNLLSGKFDLAYPYNGTFLDMSYIIRSYYMVNKKISILDNNKEKMNLLYQASGNIVAVGGAFIIDLNKFNEIGKMNEEFYGWGLEDGEFYYRSINNKLKIYRSNGPLYHLTHPRDLNGKFHSYFQTTKSKCELLKTIES